MRKTAIVTGASSGIGFALANVFARHQYDLVLVARNAERLHRAKAHLENEHGITAHVITADLTRPSTPPEIFQKTESTGGRIDVLVNNAGFAEYGPFHEADRERALATIALNITALTELTHLFLEPMIRRRTGKILNVASTAAFQPGPLMAVYYASKSYVLWFSEAIRNEVIGLGVDVTALCPGPTKTEFFEKQPKLLDSRLLLGGTMSAEEVADAGYYGLVRGRAVVIPGARNKLLAWSTRLGPRSLVVKISRWTLERKNHTPGV
jgi:short-subunit dehydrogenase